MDYVKYTLETLFEPFGYVYVDSEGPRTELSVQRVLNNPYLLAEIMRHLCAIDRVRNIMATLRVSRAFRNPHVIKETMCSIRFNRPMLRRLPQIHTMTCHLAATMRSKRRSTWWTKAPAAATDFI